MNNSKKLDKNQDMEKNNNKNTPTNEFGGLKLEGHIKIFDPTTDEIFVNKRNAIHYENFSLALANGAANTGKGFISEMVFGNGGSKVDPTGLITYLTPNSIGTNASLYNETYYKVVDSLSPYDRDPTRNFMEVRHVAGMPYSDILISCLLDYGEPTDQAAFDTSVNQDGQYIFDELGLRSYSTEGPTMGILLTHVIFHPVQKSLNRLIQIDYTVRVQALSNMV